MIKSFFKVSLASGGCSSVFQKHSYKLIEANGFILIHYMGDESVAKGFSHGNSKEKATPHIRTCPSVLRAMESQCSSKCPQATYRAALTSNVSPELASVLHPRNSKQAENLRHWYLSSKRLSQDSLYNLHYLAYDLPNYISKIETFPNLLCVCGHQGILQELDRLILVHDVNLPQLLSYDTTFQLGDFYVSAFCFRNILFKENPVIPAAFLIHEKKLQYGHEQFLQTVLTLIPNLSRCTLVPLVTDEEAGVINAIEKVLPNIPRLRCWNHLIRDVKRWLSAHGASSAEITVYIDNIRSLLHQPSEDNYKFQFEMFKSQWSAPFTLYYTNNIHSKITSFARWAIERYHVYNPYSGVTSNQAESLNRVLKELQEWKEAPVDCMVLSLYYLQSFYYLEICRGFHGLGDYHLCTQYADVEFIPIPEGSVIKPEDIVERIKGNFMYEYSTLFADETSSSPDPSINVANLTQNERAHKVLEEKKISFDTTLGVFNVQGTSRVHTVKLFPSESCTCPATGTCYHVFAARLTLGIEEKPSQKRKLSLTQLRKNVRKPRKKSGRKKPRIDDYDVLPAPDALNPEDDGKKNSILK